MRTKATACLAGPSSGAVKHLIIWTFRGNAYCQLILKPTKKSVYSGPEPAWTIKTSLGIIFFLVIATAAAVVIVAAVLAIVETMPVRSHTCCIQ